MRCVYRKYTKSDDLTGKVRLTLFLFFCPVHSRSFSFKIPPHLYAINMALDETLRTRKMKGPKLDARNFTFTSTFVIALIFNCVSQLNLSYVWTFWCVFTLIMMICCLVPRYALLSRADEREGQRGQRAPGLQQQMSKFQIIRCIQEPANRSSLQGS